MTTVGYKASIGSWSIDSKADARTELTRIDVCHSMNSAGDAARLFIYAPPPKKKGLLDEAVGAATDMAAGALGLGGGGAKSKAFAIKVRGNDVKHGDQLTIELTSGNRSGKVATLDVRAMRSSLGQTDIDAATGKRALANARVNQVYENQSLGQIVKDLAGQAKVATSTIDSGSTYPYIVVHESRSVFAHILDLARREGLDVYFDEENKLTVTKFSKTSADHIFNYGIDLLDITTLNHEPPSDHVLVYGESASSNQGSNTWHWLAKDLKPFRGELGSGAKIAALGDRALRTKDAADSQAKAKLGAIKDNATSGRLVILGNPMVKLGQAIEIKSAPPPELNGLFKVTSVRHRYGKQEGFLTTLGFTGQGGAKEAEGMLGQALGALAGAVGL